MRLTDILLQTGEIKVEHLKARPRFVVDNISEYYYRHKKEYWRLMDFPTPMPPYDRMWVEYRIPPNFYSDEYGELKVIPPGYQAYFGIYLDKHEGDWWGVSGAQYISAANGGRVASPLRFVCRFRLAPQEDFIHEVEVRPEDLPDFLVADFKENQNEAIATFLYDLHPVLMAFSLLNCKNVEIVEVEAPPKLQKAREKRGKPPIAPYRVINVLPLNVHERRVRKVYLGEKTTSKVSTEMRMQRGSFATYTDADGHRLFGKYSGTYWRPATAVLGEKEYRVKVKEHTNVG